MHGFGVAVVAVAVVLPSAAVADAGASATRSCATPPGFMTGPFIVFDKIRARGVSCDAARAQVTRWGRTRDCVSPSSPQDHVCRAGRYRCVTRVIGYESLRATCKRGKDRAVGFHFGS